MGIVTDTNLPTSVNVKPDNDSPAAYLDTTTNDSNLRSYIETLTMGLKAAMAKLNAHYKKKDEETSKEIESI